MAQLKLLRNVWCKQIDINKLFITKAYGSIGLNNFSTAAVSEANQISWDEAKPLQSMPQTSAIKTLLAFLPGGKFHNKDLAEITIQNFKDHGDILLIPGIFGKADLVVTQNPDDFATVFRNDGMWPNRKGFEILTVYRNEYRKDFFGVKSGLLTTQGKDWGEFRSTVNPILMHPKNVKDYLQTMSKVNEEFIERIKQIRNPETLEMPDNFKDEISCWTLESVSVVALDKQLGLISGVNPNAKKFFNDLQEFFTLTVDLEIKPSMWRQFPTKKLKRVFSLLDEMIEFCEHHVDEAIQRIEGTSTNKAIGEQSVLERILKVDKKLAMIMAMDMLFAGVDTTTTTFTGLLLCLAKNPDKQEKLRQELLQILPEKNSPLTVENMKNLPYLRACIKESLRIYPLAQGNVRTTNVDMVLSGYQVPKGTEVAMLFLTLLKDANHYSDPDKFVPERWLRTGSKDCPHAVKSQHPFVYLPFGFGPRSCIGKRIAEMEMEIGIARIIRNFQIEFNYSTEKAFKSLSINMPAIPLKFKFTDLDY